MESKSRGQSFPPSLILPLRGGRGGVKPLFIFLLFFLSLFSPLQATYGEPLKPEQAFPFQVKTLKPDLVEVRFQIAPGHYLYRDKLKFAVEPDRIKLGTPQFPAGQVKEDPGFGKTEILRGETAILIPISSFSAAGEPITLAVTYQGCADAGLCYPPKTQKVRLSPPSPTSTAGQVTTFPPGAGEMVSETPDIARLFGSGNFFWIILSFFGFGLLLSFTPCVFPMFPIISGIIVAQGKDLTKKRAFSLSLIYVLGMALTYSSAGVVAGFSGRLIAVALQNPWVLSAFALIFILLALSMFGFYELQVPSFIQSKFTSASNRCTAGTCSGVFLMGLLSAIIVGPCITAPLAGALLYIGQTHNVLLGGMALFFLALGMGVPLLIIGTSAGALLPKAGAWMNAVKAFFGVMMIAVAFWLISPIIPDPLQLFLWGALLIICSIYLSALDPLPQSSTGWAKFQKGVGIIALILGASLLIGAMMGARDLLQPLSGISQKSKQYADQKNPSFPVPELTLEKITRLDQFETRLKAAESPTVMLLVSADWCTACKEMEEFTLKDPRVQEKLKNIKILNADVSKSDAETVAFLKKFGLFGPPAVLFFNQKRKEIPEARVIGYQKAEDFLKTLDKVLGR
jgi:thiol:disulfide interchange protein DsbD